MPILVKKCFVENGWIKFPTMYTGVEYVGRVMKVLEFNASRNHSDTLDYSDWRMTACTEAFVWFGPTKTERVYDRAADAGVDRIVELPILEQFGYVDCTNLFSWRGADIHTPIVDADLETGLGDPEMWVAWDKYQDALEVEKLRLLAEAQKRETEEAIRKEKEAQREAKKKAKLDVGKVEADKAMQRLPVHGTEMTYKGFTGKLFWSRVQMYRGKWKASFGLKDAGGKVQWGDAQELK